jgi:hypothetical protein
MDWLLGATSDVVLARLPCRTRTGNASADHRRGRWRVMSIPEAYPDDTCFCFGESVSGCEIQHTPGTIRWVTRETPGGSTLQCSHCSCEGERLATRCEESLGDQFLGRPTSHFTGPLPRAGGVRVELELPAGQSILACLLEAPGPYRFSRSLPTVPLLYPIPVSVQHLGICNALNDRAHSPLAAGPTPRAGNKMADHDDPCTGRAASPQYQAPKFVGGWASWVCCLIKPARRPSDQRPFWSFLVSEVCDTEHACVSAISAAAARCRQLQDFLTWRGR